MRGLRVYWGWSPRARLAGGGRQQARFSGVLFGEEGKAAASGMRRWKGSSKASEIQVSGWMVKLEEAQGPLLAAEGANVD